MSAMDLHVVAEHGLGVLWRVTWQGALWALVAWALTRALPRLPSSARAALWWLVGLKCLVGLCAPGTVRLPLLPAPETPAVVETVAPVHGDIRPMALEKNGAAPLAVPAPEHGGTRARGWVLAVLLAWIGGLAWQGRELLRGLVQLRHIRREAHPLEDATLQRAAETLGRELGLERVPRLLVSEHAPSPLALGLLRPEVILPRSALEKLSPLEQRMALAHELAHVRRGDLWLGWVPALAQALFFFHPLVRRACREYALAREEACDAAALQATGAEPREYGRLLLVFGVARAPAAAAAPGASSHLAALKRRIAMLEHAGTDSMKRLGWTRWALGGLALVALVPFQVVAREPAAPAVAQPAAPVKPPAPPAPPAPPSARDEDDDDRKYSYVLLRSANEATISGSSHDLKVARHLAGGGTQPLLYARRDDGQEFLIRDATTLRAFDDTFKTVRELGEQQEKLGEQQGNLGEQQGAIGEKQGAIGEKMGAIGEKMGALGEKQGQLARRTALLEMDDEKETPDIKRQREQLEREQKELEQQMEALERQMEPLNEQMEALGREMEKYSDPMEKLGEQMGKLGEQMELASREAETKAQSLLDDAVRKGTAEPVKR